MASLLTILHVSDIHMGNVDPVSGDAEVDAEALAWWQLHPLFDGYLGHTHVALARLVDFYLDLVETEENVVVLQTGDLTTQGAANQFAAAIRFFGATLNPGLHLGLRLGQMPGSIPGNHDHWPGVRATLLHPFCMLGGPTAALANHFPPPMPSARVPLAGGRHLLVVRLDSDSGVQPTSVKRLAARGSCVAECVQLAATLGPLPADEVRVLLIHHSTLARGYALGIDRATRTALDALVSACGIKVLLTGHHHTAAYGQHSGGVAVEARCGTTTQRDFFPRSWLFARALGALRLRSLPLNAVLVHRLDDKNGRFWWQTDVFERKLGDPAGPFRQTASYPALPL